MKEIYYKELENGDIEIFLSGIDAVNFLNTCVNTGIKPNLNGDVTDMCKAVDEIYKEGVQEGVKKGAVRMGKLVTILLQQGRTSDIERATTDSQFRAYLEKEYNI